MTQTKRTTKKTMVDGLLYGQLKIEQYQPRQKPAVKKKEKQLTGHPSCAACGLSLSTSSDVKRHVKRDCSMAEEDRDVVILLYESFCFCHIG